LVPLICVCETFAMEFAKSSWDHLFADQASSIFPPAQYQQAPPSNFVPSSAAEFWKDEEPYERQVAPSLSVDPAVNRPQLEDSFKNLEDFLLNNHTTERSSFPATQMYFSTPHTTCVSPMAFWRLSTRELVAFNDAFTQLVEYPHGVLQKAGFRWDDFKAEMWFDNPELVNQLDASMRRLQQINDLMSSGQCEFAQIDFSFISGTGRVKCLALTIVSMSEEVMWLCQEIPEMRRHSMQEMPRVLRTSLSAPPQIPSSNSPSSDFEASSVPRIRSASFDATVSTNSRGTVAERKLVKVQTRVKKPWDCNLVKFSLKTDRKKRQRTSISS